MDKFKALVDLNAAINRYFEKESVMAGNVRYWDKLFVTLEMLNDDDLVNDFRKVFEPSINTTEEKTNERKHKSTTGSRIQK